MANPIDRKVKPAPPPPAKLPPLRTQPKPGSNPATPPVVGATLPTLDAPTPPPLPQVLVPPPLPVTAPPSPNTVPVFEPWSEFSVTTNPNSEIELPLEAVRLTPPPLPPAPPREEAPASAGPPTAPTLSELGQVGPYVLKQLIGEGGMGLVYKAEDSFLKRSVALKVMKPEIAADDRAWKLFLTEAQATAALKDDRIATIYQIGEDQGQFFLAMELLKGESLESRLKRGPLSLEQALWVVRETALGLKVAHNSGFVHRDIKPANLWLETEASTQPHVDRLQQFRPGAAGGRESQYVRVKILDFGLVRLEQDGGGKRKPSVVGTPAYMAPEQAAGKSADARSDIFSLGVVFFRLLTGSMPFEGETSMEVLTALATKTAPLVSQFNPDVPKPLVELVQKMLSRDPMGRPASAADVARLLEGIEKFVLAPPPAAKGRKRTLLIGAGIALAVSLVAFGGWWFFLRGDDSSDVPVVAGASTNKVLEPREAVNAIGDKVTIEFTVGAVRRTSDQAYLYESAPTAKTEETIFRVVLPSHIISHMKRRGSPWPDALDGALVRVHGTVLREGRFAELLVSEMDQFDKILYKERSAAAKSKPAEKTKPTAESKSESREPIPQPTPPKPSPPTNPNDDLEKAVKKAARDMLAPFVGNKKK